MHKELQLNDKHFTTEDLPALRKLYDKAIAEGKDGQNVVYYKDQPILVNYLKYLLVAYHG